MRAETIGVIDYGAGNLFSVGRAIEYCGGSPLIISDPDDLAKVDRLVLPGVGAFGAGINHFLKKGFLPALQEFITRERPLLGICLGMQMLFSSSEEFGTHEGLNLIPGSVKKIDCGNQEFKIPCIGWYPLNRSLDAEAHQSFNTPLLKGVQIGDAVYFVHSYAANPTNSSNIVATTSYSSRSITAVVQRDNIYGCQFHPEKSGEIGLRIIKNFLEV